MLLLYTNINFAYYRLADYASYSAGLYILVSSISIIRARPIVRGELSAVKSCVHVLIKGHSNKEFISRLEFSECCLGQALYYTVNCERREICL